MTEPTKEQVDKWEKDAISSGKDFFGKERWVNSGEFTSFRENWIGAYLAAKKSDFEKIIELEKLSEMQVRDAFSRYKEIQTLKEQLAEAVDVIEKCRRHNYLGGESFLDRITKQFLEKQDKENGSSNESN